MRLGPPLQLYAEPPAAGGDGEGGGAAAAAAAARAPYAARAFGGPVWDEWSAAVYMRQGHAVLRLTADNTVTVVELVAGSVGEQEDADGAGSAASFSGRRGFSSSCTSDGRGRLYVADSDRIRQLQLPAAWEMGGTAGFTATAGAAAAAGGEVVVTTLPLRAPSSITGLVFDGGSGGGASGSLVYATETAIYRLPLGGEGAAAVPVLLAGREGSKGTVDGREAGALFKSNHELAFDGKGCAYVADVQSESATAVRRVARDGTTVTVATMDDDCRYLAILPNGYLALFGHYFIYVLDLGLSLPPGHAGLPPRSLAGDWGAVLDRQPDGSSDLTVVAGGCPFHVHQLVLSSRSDYYARCLGSDFAEGAAERQERQQQQVLNLPDVDPEVFKLALRFMYTGAADVPPALARAVAELADRLLLPELCAAAQAVVEAGVTPSSVVGALLWAEAAGPSFSALLGRLKGWYVAHHEEVLEAEPRAIERIAGRSIKLMAELMGSYTREAKRLRTQ